MTKERYITIISFTCIFIFFAVFFVYAWQEPTTNPPGGNVYAPVNVGPSDQFKSGRFGAYTTGIDPNYGFTVGSGGIKVTGDSYYEGNITATGQICDKNGCIGDTTTYWKLSADDTKLYPNKTDWNVGIGTTDPGYKLDVSGTIRAKDVFGAGGKNLIIGDDTYLTDIDQANMLGIYGMQNSDRAGIRLGSDGSYIFGDNGNIGIGTTNPGQKLTINGDIDMIKGQTSQIHSLGQISFDWTTGGTYDNPQYHGIQSKDESGSWSDNLRINSYNNIINTLDSNNNNGTSYFKIQHHSSGNGADLFWVRSADGNAWLRGNLSLNNTNISGVNKISVNTVDPVYKINDKRYVTYMPDMIGLKTEVVGEAQTENGVLVIDLAKQPEGSDLWLFYNIVKEETIIPFVSSQSNAQLYAHIEGSKFIIIVRGGDPNAKFSYRLIGTRKDYKQKDNLLKDPEVSTFIDIDSLK